MNEGLIKKLEEKEIKLLKDIRENPIIDPKNLTLAIALKKKRLITIEYVKKSIMKTEIVGKLTIMGKLNLAYS